jgi:hypothetical protein
VFQSEKYNSFAYNSWTNRPYPQQLPHPLEDSLHSPAAAVAVTDKPTFSGGQWRPDAGAPATDTFSLTDLTWSENTVADNRGRLTGDGTAVGLLNETDGGAVINGLLVGDDFHPELGASGTDHLDAEIRTASGLVDGGETASTAGGDVSGQVDSVGLSSDVKHAVDNGDVITGAPEYDNDFADIEHLNGGDTGVLSREYSGGDTTATLQEYAGTGDNGANAQLNDDITRDLPHVNDGDTAAMLHVYSEDVVPDSHLNDDGDTAIRHVDEATAEDKGDDTRFGFEQERIHFSPQFAARFRSIIDPKTGFQKKFFFKIDGGLLAECGKVCLNCLRGV